MCATCVCVCQNALDVLFWATVLYEKRVLLPWLVCCWFWSSCSVYNSELPLPVCVCRLLLCAFVLGFVPVYIFPHIHACVCVSMCPQYAHASVCVLVSDSNEMQWCQTRMLPTCQCNMVVLYCVIIKYCRWNWMHWACRCVCGGVCFMACVNKHLIYQLFCWACFVTLCICAICGCVPDV